MALRKASAYSKWPARPYTRHSKRKNRSYIKTVPQNKIVKYTQGNEVDYKQGKHTYTVRMFAGEPVQIRDNALEASRMVLVKSLDASAIGQYFLQVKVHPHHLMRENKSVAAVAGADRLSTGMTQSFGVVIGRSALVKSGQELFFISCANEKVAQSAKKALEMIRAKVPCRTKILFEKNQ